jgi:two-component system, sensor histidine kinase
MVRFGSLVRAVPAVNDCALGSEALTRFESDQSLRLLPVCNGQAEVIGVLRRSKFLTSLAQGFGREIYSRRPVSLLVSPSFLTIDISTSIEDVVRVISTSDDGQFEPSVVVTDHGRYVGCADTSAIYKALTDILDRKAIALDEALAASQAGSVAKANFLAAMSHEIRTPLNGILGMAQGLAATDLNAHQVDLLNVISQSGEVLLRLLDDVLDMTKIESGKLSLEVTAVDLRALLETATALYRERANGKGLQFTVSLDEVPEGLFNTDSARLKQVIYNIVSNAVKFTETGEVHVACAAVSTGTGAQYLQIGVTDTGIGMNEETITRLFAPFEQADASITRQFGGTGLGLSICKTLVELMGGEIHVSSTPGVGSRFDIRVPLVRSSKDERPLSIEATQPLARPQQSSEASELVILAAEDNPTNRLVLKTLLDGLDATLIFAEDGRQAVDAFQERSFDLILMDLQMPVMDGLQAARAIRALEAKEQRPRTPILALSANAMRHHVEEALAAGMDGHVAKPVSLPKLLDEIGQVLGASPDSESTVQAA